jgi:hypothetical protein
MTRAAQTAITLSDDDIALFCELITEVRAYRRKRPCRLDPSQQRTRHLLARHLLTRSCPRQQCSARCRATHAFDVLNDGQSGRAQPFHRQNRGAGKRARESNALFLARVGLGSGVADLRPAKLSRGMRRHSNQSNRSTRLMSTTANRTRRVLTPRAEGDLLFAGH